MVGRPYTQQQVAAWIEDENAAKTEQAFGPAQITFVAESANRIVGFARMAGDEVEALYVHPQHSGRRIGERLLAMVEDAASLRAIGIVSLDAALNAVPFYRAAGYEMVGTSRPLFDNGMELPCIRMRKVLHTDRRSKVAVEFGLQRCRPRTGMVSPAPRL
ncbi:MAG: GNAT family N-acetyltransferase [Ignavibacteriota bacterium]